MKVCSHCKQTKDWSEFPKNKSKKDGYAYQCTACRKIYLKQHYKNNKPNYVRKSLANTAKIKSWFKNFKSDKYCVICGENHPATLDFHHKNPENKYKSVANLVVNGSSIKKIKSEIEKCIIICSNCHRKLHWNENN